MEETAVVATNENVGRLRGVEFVARTPTPSGDDEKALGAFAFVTTEFDGRVTAVAAECARASVALGESVQYCAAGARRGLYDVDSPPDEGTSTGRTPGPTPSGNEASFCKSALR